VRRQVLFRAAVAMWALAGASGCGTGLNGTRVDTPAMGRPDRVGFGTGDNASAGARATSFASRAVVVAAGSDPRGPSAASEGDFVWRVRGGVLELCEWSDDGHEDCRIATYGGFQPPALLTFLPTIIEPGNLGGGPKLVDTATNLVAADTAAHATRPVLLTEDRSIWITASTPALVGAQPVFLCSVQAEGPACAALPFVAENALASVVLTRAGVRTAVLWVHAAENVTEGSFGAVRAASMGVFRCEAHRGQPECKKAKEDGE
jgi:hypothetical protein